MKVMKSVLKKKSAASPKSFTAVVDHSSGKSYGLMCTYKGKKTPLITQICPGGLLAKWNAKNAKSGRQLQPGDEIVSVNGKKTGKEQDAELDRQAEMRILIRKGPTAKTKTGQNHPQGCGCISTSKTGKPCTGLRETRSVPYCKRCMAKGDPSLKVTKHPKYGLILVATRNIPKGYMVAWWGDVRAKKEMAAKAMEWALETNTSPKRWIDATPHKGSQLQFTACPGPSEVPTIEFAPKDDVLLDIASEKCCLLFATLRSIPKNYQFTMMYNRDEKTTENFFKEMGIKRADVGTAKWPTLKKATVKAAKKGKR